jgi:hypothetical protein
MAKKKKRKVASKFAIREEVQEEIVALAAIYGEDFGLDEDNHGYRVRIVPHPGDADTNLVDLELHIRSVSIASWVDAQSHATHGLAPAPPARAAAQQPT